MVEDGAEELEDLVHFSVSELPSRGYGVMEEIRRQGKLCDVTLKVRMAGRRGAQGRGTDWGGKRGGADRGSEVYGQSGGERRFEGDRVRQREVASGRGGLRLSGEMDWHSLSALRRKG